VTLRYLLLTALVAAPACGFTAGNVTGDDVTPGDDTQQPPPVARKCALADPALRLCIDFDDDQMLTSDGSGRGHDAIGTGYMVTTRKTEQAVMVDASTQLVVAETPDLDIQNNLTLTLMARPSNYPAMGQAYWALDNNKQYFISYQHDGKFRCGIGNMVVDSSVGMTKDSWYQVACTYDHGTLKLFIEGQLAGCRTVPPIPVDGTEGLAIGGNIGVNHVFSEQFVGGLDNIQVFARTYSMDEVCTAAGKSGCFQGWGGPQGQGEGEGGGCS
jgi:Concanavalin A-like lectin/glucanases superfamily